MSAVPGAPPATGARTLREVDLVILGHGSSFDNAAAAPLFRARDLLSEQFASVRVGLVKGAPSFADALDGLGARPALAVPYLMADGWFATSRLPSIVGRLAEQSGLEITVTRSVGTTRRMCALGAEAAARYGAEMMREATALVVGHGTPRDARSADSTRVCARAIEGTGLFARVDVALIDDAPRLDAWRAQNRDPDVLVVPYFAGPGPHVYDDIPGALDVSPGPADGRTAEVDGQRFRFMPPVGALDGAHEAVLERAFEWLAAQSNDTTTDTDGSGI